MTELKSMLEYLLFIRGMTTSELCEAMPSEYSRPRWRGNVEDSVKAFLQVDAINWKLVGNYAKFLSRKVNVDMFIPKDDGYSSKVLFAGDWKLSTGKLNIKGVSHLEDTSGKYPSILLGDVDRVEDLVPYNLTLVEDILKLT